MINSAQNGTSESFSHALRWGEDAVSEVVADV
jgi:hypothetical protein